MLKYVLLATSVAIASPAFAQDAPAAADKTMPQQQAPAPAQAAPPPADSAQPAEAQPVTARTAPTPETQPALAAAQPAPAQPAAPAPVQPATDASQVAQVIGQEFASYDKDSSGALDKAEFSTWLVALRKASDASFQGDSPAATTWLAQAFTQADTDKNATVTQAELTTFLSPKPA